MVAASYDVFLNRGVDNNIVLPYTASSGDVSPRITFSKRESVPGNIISGVSVTVVGNGINLTIPAASVTDANFPCYYSLFVTNGGIEYRVLVGRIILVAAPPTQNTGGSDLPVAGTGDEGKILGISNGQYALVNIDGGVA